MRLKDEFIEIAWQILMTFMDAYWLGGIIV